LTVETAVQDVLSAAGRYTTAESAEVLLPSGEPIRLYLMGQESVTFTTAGSPSTHDFTLSSPPIRSTRTAPTLPTNAHPDVRVVVTSSGAGVAAGTYLPVTAFSDGSLTLTVDTSGLTGSTSVTVAIRYLPANQYVQLQVAAPVGSQVRTKALIETGTRDAFGRDPTQTGSALTIPFLAGSRAVVLPRYFQLNVMAKYTNTTPTLTDSDILIPARTAIGTYVDPSAESLRAMRLLGLA